MRDPDEFDAFYRGANERLLLQTYALTGDLSAARGAVRDSFIVAWHHWRKISRLDDPEESVRPHAWRHAQRRHTARLWHRDKDIDPDVKATLDALATLTVNQRRALLLTQLAAVSMPQMAREIGLPLEEAERELQSGASQFALARNIAASEIPGQFEPLNAVVREVRFPRPPIVRRAGAARRRTHTTVGVAAVVAAFLLTGSLVTNTAGVHPTLSSERGTATPPATKTPVVPALPEVVLPEESLLTPVQLAGAVKGRTWEINRTGDNSEGSGLLTPCQQERYADPRGTAALVRTFAAAPAKKLPRTKAVQLTEASATPRAAKRAYRTAVGWYAACLVERTQLMSTRRVDQVGDEAMLIVLRSWSEPVETMAVAIARTGEFVTTTMSMVRSDDEADAQAVSGLLREAVNGLCTLPRAGRCSGRARLVNVPPLPVGSTPAMLSEIDLPPITNVRKPWVGTEPHKATDNDAATRCDNATFRGDFEGKPFTHNLTRTFLVPEGGLPVEFGLTETVASLPVKRAIKFVDQVRARLASCAERDLGTDVTRVAHSDAKNTDLTVWQLTTEISDKVSLSYSMAIIRNGTSLAQVGFVPAGRQRLSNGAFVDLALRALQRLRELPRPSQRPAQR